MRFISVLLFLTAIRAGAAPDLSKELQDLTRRERMLSVRANQFKTRKQNLRQEIQQSDVELNQNRVLQMAEKKDFFSVLRGIQNLRNGKWAQVFEHSGSVADADFSLTILHRVADRIAALIRETRSVAFATRQRFLALTAKSKRFVNLEKGYAQICAELDRVTRNKSQILEGLSHQGDSVFILAKGSLPTPIAPAGHEVGENDELFLSGTNGAPVRSVFDGRIEAVQTISPWNTVVVIDHGDSYESVYLNVKNVKVRAGEFVHAGSTIAEVASETIRKRSGILFEIAHFGIEDQTSSWLTPERKVYE